ncbi:MAG: hypothetical protein FWG56_04295 [Desulfovibrionaceae bacterium]|nr:hypothetical protein [Desulfovibrionaceae bacterium]
MLPGLEMMVGCPNQAVPAGVMRRVVSVESGVNPSVIGVAGGRLTRQQSQGPDETASSAG